MAKNGTRCVSSATVQINGTTISIVPNSLRITDGVGQTTVRAMSNGGNSVTLVTSQDVSTKVAKINFEVVFTPDIRDFIREVQQNRDENICRIFDNDPELNVQDDFAQFTITNDIEWAYSADGTCAIEASASPAL